MFGRFHTNFHFDSLLKDNDGRGFKAGVGFFYLAQFLCRVMMKFKFEAMNQAAIVTVVENDAALGDQFSSELVWSDNGGADDRNDDVILPALELSIV